MRKRRCEYIVSTFVVLNAAGALYDRRFVFVEALGAWSCDPLLTGDDLHAWYRVHSARLVGDLTRVDGFHFRAEYI